MEPVFTVRTIRVLQTEAGFVPFCHSGSVDCEKVVVCKHFDAVVVPVNTPPNLSLVFTKVSMFILASIE